MSLSRERSSIKCMAKLATVSGVQCPNRDGPVPSAATPIGQERHNQAISPHCVERSVAAFCRKSGMSKSRCSGQEVLESGGMVQGASNQLRVHMVSLCSGRITRRCSEPGHIKCSAAGGRAKSAHERFRARVLKRRARSLNLVVMRPSSRTSRIMMPRSVRGAKERII